MENNFLRYV